MKLPFNSDKGYGSKPAIGLVVLSTDETIEPEFRQIHTDPATSVFHSRIQFEPLVTPETLADMEMALPTSLSLFSRHIGLHLRRNYNWSAKNFCNCSGVFPGGAGK